MFVEPEMIEGLTLAIPERATRWGGPGRRDAARILSAIEAATRAQ